jgi:hypothetical protein
MHLNNLFKHTEYGFYAQSIPNHWLQFSSCLRVFFNDKSCNELGPEKISKTDEKYLVYFYKIELPLQIVAFARLSTTKWSSDTVIAREISVKINFSCNWLIDFVCEKYSAV